MAIDGGFTQKEMLIRILDKLEKMEDKIQGTHELAVKTNGKVRIHTKLICALFGAITTIAGWIIYLKFNLI